MDAASYYKPKELQVPSHKCITVWNVNYFYCISSFFIQLLWIICTFSRRQGSQWISTRSVPTVCIRLSRRAKQPSGDEERHNKEVQDEKLLASRHTPAHTHPDSRQCRSSLQLQHLHVENRRVATASAGLLTSSPSCSWSAAVSSLLWPDIISVNYGTHTHACAHGRARSCTFMRNFTNAAHTVLHICLHKIYIEICKHTLIQTQIWAQCCKHIHTIHRRGHTHQHTAIYPGSTPGNQHYPCELLNGHLVKKDNSSAARDSRDKLPERAHTHMHTHKCVCNAIVIQFSLVVKLAWVTIKKTHQLYVSPLLGIIRRHLIL